MEKVVTKIIKQYARSGAATAKAVLANGRSYFLHSSYDPEQEARDWVNALNITPYSAYIVFGLGLGYHVRALLNRVPDNCRVIVVEYSQDESMLTLASQLFPQKKWLKDPRVQFLVGPNLHALGSGIAHTMRRSKIKKVTLCPFYPIMQLFPGFYEDCTSDLVDRAEDIFTLNMNFECGMAAKVLENAWRNLPRVCNSPGITGFKNTLQGIPAIVVSAGPSLNKNIEQLREYTGKAFIIASGSAIGAMAARGLTPHMIAVIDPTDSMYTEVEGRLTPDMALLGFPQIHHKVVAEHPGIAVFAKPALDVYADLAPLLPATELIETSVSVATAAFNFCVYSGANPIIFMGQDLAYTADATHAEGIREAGNPENAPRELKGANGGMVRTGHELFQVWQYFVYTIAKLNSMDKNRRIINATEGGAFLDGTEHMSFREAAARFLTKEYDIPGMIATVAGNAALPQKEELLPKLNRISAEVLAVRERIAKDCADLTPEPGEDDLRISVARLRKLLDSIKNEYIYPLIKFYVEPLFEAHAHSLQKDLPLSEEYKEKFVLKDAIYGYLDKFNELVEYATERINLPEMTGKGGGADD